MGTGTGQEDRIGLSGSQAPPADDLDCRDAPSNSRAIDAVLTPYRGEVSAGWLEGGGLYAANPTGHDGKGRGRGSPAEVLKKNDPNYVNKSLRSE